LCYAKANALHCAKVSNICDLPGIRQFKERSNYQQTAMFSGLTPHGGGKTEPAESGRITQLFRRATADNRVAKTTPQMKLVSY